MIISGTTNPLSAPLSAAWKLQTRISPGLGGNRMPMRIGEVDQDACNHWSVASSCSSSRWSWSLEAIAPGPVWTPAEGALLGSLSAGHSSINPSRFHTPAPFRQPASQHASGWSLQPMQASRAPTQTAQFAFANLHKRPGKRLAPGAARGGASTGVLNNDVLWTYCPGIWPCQRSVKPQWMS